MTNERSVAGDVKGARTNGDGFVKSAFAPKETNINARMKREDGVSEFGGIKRSANFKFKDGQREPRGGEGPKTTEGG